MTHEAVAQQLESAKAALFAASIAIDTAVTLLEPPESQERPLEGPESPPEPTESQPGPTAPPLQSGTLRATVLADEGPTVETFGGEYDVND